MYLDKKNTTTNVVASSMLPMSHKSIKVISSQEAVVCNI